MYSYWKISPNWQRDQPLSGVSIILANYTIGRYAEYQDWYDNVHSGEVINVPGHVGMKRGELSELQIEPRRYCPGDQLVLCAQQTDDLLFTIRDFSARSEEHTSELQSLMRISYAVFCLKKKKTKNKD